MDVQANHLTTNAYVDQVIFQHVCGVHTAELKAEVCFHLAARGVKSAISICEGQTRVRPSYSYPYLEPFAAGQTPCLNHT
ncbi:hypothetical protein I7I53_07805 [Histoplasma capsulatum var. duboisii H88]|uniref:Uncharacterized protein n=1 Tax=Ajellomyces capsulatus (strain H88) TaxID=544711 RepID=A0A8A1LH31_AJEC8|nr:hypothetical protein I7I53_07805 [Histoplasma capsulatum var. duboisii H88]